MGKDTQKKSKKEAKPAKVVVDESESESEDALP